MKSHFAKIHDRNERYVPPEDSEEPQRLKHYGGEPMKKHFEPEEETHSSCIKAVDKTCRKCKTHLGTSFIQALPVNVC